MNNSAPAIEVSGLSKRFDATVALDDVSFSIDKGEVRALIGENGAGKSTLVKILSGLIRQDSGSVILHVPYLFVLLISGRHKDK